MIDESGPARGLATIHQIAMRAAPASHMLSAGATSEVAARGEFDGEGMSVPASAGNCPCLPEVSAGPVYLHS